jgi:hypothetical protein
MSSDLLLIIGIVAGCAAFSGVVAYFVVGRDLEGRSRVLAALALACAVLVGMTCLYIPYLPVLGFLGAAAGYLVLRHLVRVRVALAGAAVLLFGACSLSVLTMVAALSSM